MKIVTCIILGLFSLSANAEIIDFEGGLDSRFTYIGDLRTPLTSSRGGYGVMESETGSQNSVFNANESSPITFNWNNPGTFDLSSFLIVGAWGTQTLTIEGSLNNVVQNSATLPITNTSVTTFAPNWTNLDAFTITIGNDFLLTPNLGGRGQHWVLDNLNINAVAAVPEPSIYAMFLVGLSLISFYKKKQA